MAALEVPMALKPATSKMRALAASQAFGRSRMRGPLWRRRKCMALDFSVGSGMKLIVA